MFLIEKLKTVDSTNTYAKTSSINKVIISEEQTKGKGRFNRVWNSSKGGLWFSMIIKPDKELFKYTFIASLAVCHAIDSININTKIKWPNDIYFEKKKICGILSEIESENARIEKIIIGIGVNVNNHIPENLKNIAISLKEIKKEEIDLDRLLKQIIDNFKILRKKEFKEILKEYKKRLTILNKEIRVRTVDKMIEGKVIDIDNDGNLILETKEKNRIGLNEGDVSIL